MGGRDKLAAELAGRPVLAWSLAAIAASPMVRRIALVRTAGAGRRAAARRGCPPRSSRWCPAAPGDRSPSPPASGRSRRPRRRRGGRPAAAPRNGTWCSFTMAPGRWSRSGSWRPWRGGGRARRRDPRVAGERDPQARRRRHRHATIDRSGVATAQTPQGVRWDVLEQALGRVSPPTPRELTDEAALLEAAGIAVHAVPGEAANLKITRPRTSTSRRYGSPGRARSARGSARTAIRSDPATGCGSAASRSGARRGSTGTLTATPRSMPSPARSSAPSPLATSAGSTPPTSARLAASPARTCSGVSAARSPPRAGSPSRWTSRSARAGHGWRTTCPGCAPRSPGCCASTCRLSA